jgi:hypothetical protein
MLIALVFDTVPNWEVTMTMESSVETPLMSGQNCKDQSAENIHHTLGEIRALELASKSTDETRPVYRTVGEFSVDEFFEKFGLIQSSLFRLTQSSYSKFLPKVVVFHCTSAEFTENETPSLIGDELFISHEFFKAWISSTNNETFEKGLLKLIIRKIELEPSFKN